MAEQPLLVDLHQHARPASFWQGLADKGYRIWGGRPFPPPWVPDQTLAMMDDTGIGFAVLSSPDADHAFSDLDFALRHARLINEFYAGLMARWPGRFGALVCPPMPHIDAALAEIAYGLDVLKLDGVCLLSSYAGGRYTGSPEFDPILEELDRRGAYCFIHPSVPAGLDLQAPNIPNFVLEFVNDTTRCIANFVQRGLHRRFPNVRFQFSHAGGNAPYLAARLALIELFGNPQSPTTVEAARAEVLEALRSFHYDIALSAVDPVLSMLVEVVGLDRIVFGSDFPQARPPFVQETARGLRQSAVLDASAKRAIAHGNACRLIPRLADLEGLRTKEAA